VNNRSRVRILVALAVGAAAVFVALTIAVSSNRSLALDSEAFRLADRLRSPWLDHVARVVTTLGLIAIVAPVVLLGAAFVFRRGYAARGAALVAGAALTWIGVWLVKTVVGRARPPSPLVHTAGQSYPSAHAANSIGWIALAVALAPVIPSRCGRIIAVTAGAILAVLVGLSRIYLRAHYASDVVGGEALAVSMYALAALAALALQARSERARERASPGATASSGR
jgi:membrane-associated phospholipid phosphatase